MSDGAPPGVLVGAGKEAEVFAWRDGVLKLYRRPERKEAAFREAATLALVASLGLPAPRVASVEEVNRRWGISMTRVEGTAFAERMLADRGKVPRHIEAMAALHAAIHRQPGSPLGSMKARLAANIERADALDATLRQRLHDGLAGMPDGDRLCHGDFHPGNILGEIGHETVVDWLDACSGEPAADVCRSFVLMRPAFPDLAAAYVDAYTRGTGIRRDEIMRWRPFVAAGRLAEGVANEAKALTTMAAL